MKLEDIAKITIDEVTAELEKIQKLDEIRGDIVRVEESVANRVENDDKSTIKPEFKDESVNSEIIFLKNLKERIGVLFEGLNSSDNSNMELKLDLTIKFLEFALANIEHRLTNLSK
ncbi:hypothetical protein BWK67_02315 [Campylobacter fetus]|nr:hypothetical protein HHI31_02755 [Campylobacter fetus subsp. venerealis]RUT51373.1 hypothetical protein BWK67_02315 [Campylobacter fetus]RUT52102.1 hypothetical protein BWK51_02320 [Campylobacter fetus]